MDTNLNVMAENKHFRCTIWNLIKNSWLGNQLSTSLRFEILSYPLPFSHEMDTNLKFMSIVLLSLISL